MTVRFRIALLTAVLLAAVLSAGGYVWNVRQSQAEARAAAPAVPTIRDLAGLRTQPHLVFRSTAQGGSYGRVAVVPLSAPDGPRAVTPVSCDRVYATATDAICMSADRGLVTHYRTRLLDSSWSPARDLPVTGLPSRARLSRDGSLVATTTFVFGDSYASPGQFSTRTVVTRAKGEVVGDLETFRLTVDGTAVTAADRNVWGVTFADDDRFYATAASGGKTWLVEGSLAARRMTSVRADAECPSRSPDGTRIAFKKHGDLPAGRWRLAVYDLRTGAETVLAETRSVDDQAEWLDDRTVVYGLPRDTAGTASSDVWQVPADGSGAPRILVPDAWSPAVVRVTAGHVGERKSVLSSVPGGGPGGSRGDLLVYLAGTRYDGPAGTDRHIADELSALTPVLYVDPPMSALTRLRHPELAGSWQQPPLVTVRPGLARLTPHVTPGMYRPGAYRLVPPLMRRAVRRAVDRLYGGPATAVAAVLSTRTESLLGAVPARRTLFYATDDLVAGADLLGIPRDRLVAQETATLRRAQAVAVVSLPLQERYAALAFAATLVPNGCAPEAYAGVDTAAVPDDARMPGPVAGFVGHVNDRIDLGLLEAVADTGCSLLIVGPVAAGYQAARFSALAARPNVRHVGAKTFAELPGYLRVIDVGLTPYADTAFNRASFPLKTLEYLAAGRDVVSTPLPANDWLDSALISVAAGASAFAAVTGQALRRPRPQAVAQQRREFAARHSWRHRARTLAGLAGLAGRPPATTTRGDIA